ANARSKAYDACLAVGYQSVMSGTIHAARCVVLSSLVFVGSSSSEGRSACEKSAAIIGRVEYVVMEDVRMKLKARIDTGAGVSSIDAKIVEIKPVADGSGERVIFQIKDDEGKIKSIERTIVEWAEIKGKGTRRAVRRPVVRLDFCLGGKRLEGRINLTDRSMFLYPVLIGRNILKTGDFLIDPRKKFMRKPGC
ncbi:MAG: RimK/LysX family protein, partial [Gammaproteobacteria bacterium]